MNILDESDLPLDVTIELTREGVEEYLVVTKAVAVKAPLQDCPTYDDKVSRALMAVQFLEALVGPHILEDRAEIFADQTLTKTLKRMARGGMGHMRVDPPDPKKPDSSWTAAVRMKDGRVLSGAGPTILEMVASLQQSEKDSG